MEREVTRIDNNGEENEKHISCISQFIDSARFSETFYTFPYEEAKFSKLKYFLIIIIKDFFLVL